VPFQGPRLARNQHISTVGINSDIGVLSQVRKTAIVLVLWAFPVFAPIMPPLPPVTDDRESIRTFIGALERRGFTIQSNIFAGMAEQESRSSHRTNRDPRKGIILGRDKDTGAMQIVLGHEKDLKKRFGSNFSLTNLADNLMGGAQLYQDRYLYYLRKGWSERESTYRAVQAYNCGIVGRTWKSRLYRRRHYLYHVLFYAENKAIPLKYR